MRLGARGEGGDLLVPDMQPFNFALSANRIGNAVQAVAHNAVNPFDTSGGKGLGELVSDRFLHWALLHRRYSPCAELLWHTSYRAEFVRETNSDNFPPHPQERYD